MPHALAAPSVTADARWAAVIARDPSARFVYSVASTGVYCRPSCPSRRPLPRNVAFHETPILAELAGFRPCKRCRPAERAANPSAAAVVAMCALLEESAEPPSLAALAQHVGLSPSHAQRVFKGATGLTPKAYRDALRRRRVHAELQSRRSVTEAIYSAGFNASSRFYDHVARMLGMSPQQYRTGARGVTIRFAVGECSLGSILVAATERGVCAIALGDDPQTLVHDLERRFRHAELVGADAGFEATVARVIGLAEAHPGASATELPLDIQGTVFQERVWRALRAIPSGATTTYAELAAALGMPRASRAIARACASNPLALVIPCHRVVRSDGSLAGYRWGVERKRELLRRESARA